jgi:hypothetical protein
MQIRSVELAYIPRSKTPQRVPLEGHQIAWEAPSPQVRWSDPLVRQLRHVPTEKLELAGALTALTGAGLALGLGLNGHTTAALVSGGIGGLGTLALVAARAIDGALTRLEPRANANLQTDLRRSQVLHESAAVLRKSNQPLQHHRFDKAEVVQAGERMVLSFPQTGRWVVVDPSREVPVQEFRSDGSALLRNWTSQHPLQHLELEAASGILSARSSDGTRQSRIDLNTGEAELRGPDYQTRVGPDGRLAQPPRSVLDQLRYSHEGLVSLRQPESGHYHLEPVPFDLEAFGYQVQLPGGSK